MSARESARESASENASEELGFNDPRARAPMLPISPFSESKIRIGHKEVEISIGESPPSEGQLDLNVIENKGKPMRPAEIHFTW